MNRDRAEGALLGLAVGDALGTTDEFRRIEQPDYPTLATGPATSIIGEGPFGLAPGQVTDDTQLAICIARSFTERGGFDPADIAKKYVAWSKHAFDIGSQTLGAIDRLEDGHSFMSAGLSVWRDRDRRPAGNGSLMRTAPVAVALADRPLLEVVEAVVVESMITHADPRCVLACAAFDAAIFVALHDAPVDDMLQTAREAAQIACNAILRPKWMDPTDRECLERALDEILSDLEVARADRPDVYRPGMHLHDTAGFVRVAFRLAFWHCVHTPSWHDAVVDVASRGGDADTNAAIVGALLGARDGASAIPAAWRERVLAATQPGPPDWAEAHHPRHLLALVK